LKKILIAHKKLSLVKRKGKGKGKEKEKDDSSSHPISVEKTATRKEVIQNKKASSSKGHHGYA
jgi:hypothetical protein